MRSKRTSGGVRRSADEERVGDADGTQGVGVGRGAENGVVRWPTFDCQASRSVMQPMKAERVSADTP